MSSAHATPATGDKKKHGDVLPSCTLENSFDMIVKIYHQYSPREGKDDFLSRKDLKQLMEDQLPTFLAACGRNRPGYLEKLFKDSDIDKNNQLTFKEYVRIVGIVCDDAHRISHNEDRCGPDRD